MDFSVDNLGGFLIRSKLMTAPEMLAMKERWKAEAGAAIANVPAFSKWLVANGYVTEYQAGLLVKGHVDDFFLDQYKILNRLGSGRMAGVYKATRGSGPPVAIKVLPPSRAQNAQFLARFQREAQLSLKLKHPNCVRSFQVGQARGLNYLVMEFIDGETVDEVLSRRRRLPPHEAVRIVHQALAGLEHINDQGMVHRDLKPSNLMLTPARQAGEPDTTLHATVKILDIGLGRLMIDDGNLAARADITADGVLLGTPDYLAPEQARDPRNCTIQADIYSLGCVLYHLLTGQPPFPDANLLAQMVRHATEEPRPVRDFNASVSEGLQQIIGYMMAKAPEQRYPTPQRAAQALQMFLLADADKPSSGPIPKVPEPKPPSGTIPKVPEPKPPSGTLPKVLPPKPPSETMPKLALPEPKPASPAPAAVGSWLSGNLPPAKTEPRQSSAPPTPAPPPRDPRKKPKKPKSERSQPLDIDVELVPMPDQDIDVIPLDEPPRPALLSRRDLILLSIGAGTLVVLALGVVAIYLIFFAAD